MLSLSRPPLSCSATSASRRNPNSTGCCASSTQPILSVKLSCAQAQLANAAMSVNATKTLATLFIFYFPVPCPVELIKRVTGSRGHGRTPSIIRVSHIAVDPDIHLPGLVLGGDQIG